MKRFSIIGLFLPVFSICLYAQVPQEMITREQYLDRLEERFRNASSELEEITGVKFEVPQDSLSQPNAAQSAFDALPGFQSKPPPKIIPIQKKSPDLLSDDEVIREIMKNAYEAESLEMVENVESNSSFEEKVEIVEVVAPRFLEDEIGSFFIQPFIGLSIITGDSKVGATLPNVELDLGYNIGLSAGRRWGNLEGELHFGYVRNSFSKDFINSSGNPNYIDGNMESTGFSTKLAYGMAMNENGWIKAGFGLGFSERRISIDLSEAAGPVGGTSDSEAVFTYELLAAMAYELGIGWDAILSYRFLTMAEFGPTDDVSLHLFEVGLGKNF